MSQRFARTVKTVIVLISICIVGTVFADQKSVDALKAQLATVNAQIKAQGTNGDPEKLADLKAQRDDLQDQIKEEKETCADCGASFYGASKTAAILNSILPFTTGLHAVQDPAKISVYYAAYQDYMKQQAAEGAASAKCASEDPKNPSKVCSDRFAAFQKQAKLEAKAGVEFQNNFVNECKKTGQTPVIMSDYWSCEPPAKNVQAEQPVKPGYGGITGGNYGGIAGGNYGGITGGAAGSISGSVPTTADKPQ